MKAMKRWGSSTTLVIQNGMLYEIWKSELSTTIRLEPQLGNIKRERPSLTLAPVAQFLHFSVNMGTKQIEN